MVVKLNRMMKQLKIINRRDFTNNERILLTLLSIVIMLWLSFKFVIDPQLYNILSLESELKGYNILIEENSNILKNKRETFDTRNILFEEKKKIENDFFKTLNQPHIIYVLNELLLDSDIELDSISFSKPFIEPLKNQEIQKMDISIPFKGTFIALTEIVKKLEEEPKRIRINSIDMQKDEETEIIGTINLGVYSLSRIDEEKDDTDSIKITDDNLVGPFVAYEGYVAPDKTIQELEEVLDQQNNGSSELIQETVGETLENKPIDFDIYETYSAVEGDNISYISMRYYNTAQYVDEILSLNNMVRSSILPIGKVLKLKKR